MRRFLISVLVLSLLVTGTGSEAGATASVFHPELLRALECEVMVFAEVSRCTHVDQRAPSSQRPHMRAAEWPMFCERLDKVAERMQREGLRLAYHHHMGTLVQSQQDVTELIEWPLAHQWQRPHDGMKLTAFLMKVLKRNWKRL